MADFVLGDVASMTLSNPIQQSNRKNYFALYAQDSWQMNRKLTLNAACAGSLTFPTTTPKDKATSSTWQATSRACTA